MTTTLHPALADDIVKFVCQANRLGSPNSGQIGTLSALGLLQMHRAARRQDSVITVVNLTALTGLSQSAIQSHLRFWVGRRVVVKDKNAAGVVVYRLNLAINISREA